MKWLKLVLELASAVLNTVIMGLCIHYVLLVLYNMEMASASWKVYLVYGLVYNFIVTHTTELIRERILKVNERGIKL